MRAKKTYVVGNWKMHGSQSQLEAFFSFLSTQSLPFDEVEAILCPPFPYLQQASQWAQSIPSLKLGAQDVSSFQEGPYTGQVSASMLQEQGCRYVIVGHSERRLYCQESDELVASKFFAAKAYGLIPILCVGETQAQRQAGLSEKVVLDQLKVILRQDRAAFKQAIVAYEPIWAIGSGLSASAEDAQQIHHLLRGAIAEYDATVESVPILYGGSVKPDNAHAFFAMKDIDGVLVGGASLQAMDFLKISKAAIN